MTGKPEPSLAQNQQSQEPSHQRILSGAQIRRATGLIAAAYILSAVVGIARQAIIASQFGAGNELDAFWAAYRIPELLFTLVAGGALGSAFIPVFSRYLGNEEIDNAWRLASAVMSLVGIIGAVLAIIAALIAPIITSRILLPSATPEQQALTTELMRIMLGTVVVFGLSGLLMGILNANQHFLAPALAPSMNNIGLIIGAVFFSSRFGVYGLAMGAFAGALLHLGIQLPALRTIHPHIRFLPDIRVPGVKEVLWLMGPRIIGQGVIQVNFLVNTALSSGMVEGSFTALTVAFQLMFTVLGVLAQSVGTAVFPSLSLLGGKGDMGGFRQTLTGALRNVLFMSIPASVGMLVLAVPIVATISERGRWTAEATAKTAWALQFFAFGLAGFALQEVLARAFYALRDTATPVRIAVGGMLLNVVLSLILIRVVQGEGPFGGLALANSLATMVESLILWIFLRRRVNGLDERNVLDMVARTVIASLVMGVIVYMIARQFAGLSAPILLVLGAVIGAGVFEGMALVLGIAEARSVPGTLLRRFRR